MMFITFLTLHKVMQSNACLVVKSLESSVHPPAYMYNRCHFYFGKVEYSTMCLWCDIQSQG